MGPLEIISGHFSTYSIARPAGMNPHSKRMVSSFKVEMRAETQRRTDVWEERSNALQQNYGRHGDATVVWVKRTIRASRQMLFIDNKGNPLFTVLSTLHFKCMLA